MAQLVVTYMEMLGPPRGAKPLAPADAIVRREAPAREDYLALYHAVGDPLRWDEHVTMAASALDAFLSDPATHIHVLRLGRRAGGFCEFSGAGGDTVELTHFGLIPVLQGRGLGPFLLHQALVDLWGLGPTRRVWLRTDSWDHPKAIATYAHAGFRVFDRRTISVAG
ncbi:GNAT family N-acetyltransferase [Zavarzinia compransoris]|uniref:GNAT family N-acetyltransferase n=1 Tax=Zavarzinia compransoris TaxID=1264899 RepID=A0A317E5Y5_9PROT|nr:GNAT family N-acetyltransferase [Zavarzinia compransoris]PWR20793.1 GNAT family N-acetyltransferase [Zavarzinia compransoris]TDP44372.1 hypothetical protein DES42_107137 [Zavarzinia compransoris]